MHVHLDHDNCIEIIVLRGRSDRIADAATRMLAIRGVTHGGVEMVSESALAASRSHRHDDKPHAHAHGEPTHVPPKTTSRKRK
jgi:CopG family nickel-responsive transcriptional regulator